MNPLYADPAWGIAWSLVRLRRPADAAPVFEEAIGKGASHPSAHDAILLFAGFVSLATKARAPDELRGLVYGLTPRPVDTAVPWYERPVALAAVVLAVTLALNVVFF